MSTTTTTTSSSTSNSNLPVVQVEIVNGKPAVTSLQLAEAFGKEHDKVLRDIRNILENDDFTAANFGASEYHDSTGRSLPMFILSRDGFLMVALAYTGDKAKALRKAYIIKFSEMEEALNKNVVALPNFADPVVAARAWANVMEQKRETEQQLALATPKAHVYDTLVADKTISLYAFARKLTGINCQGIKQTLADLGYLYKTKYTAYRVYSEYRGILFDEKLVGGKNDITVLDAGKKKLTQLYKQGLLGMRKGRA